jgi:D-threonate/D-erythronate kinase
VVVDALHVIADDLTGACDVAGALLPWPTGITVYPDGMVPAEQRADGQPLAIRNTQSRTLRPAAAARRVREALASVGRDFDGVLLKKIDTGLRGPLGAEIDAALDTLGVAQAFVLPAIPEVGRTTVGGEQLVGGVPVNRTAFAHDPHNPVHDARVAAVIEATSRRRTGGIELQAVREPSGIEAALAGCRAPVVVVDAETDEDLSNCVRALLARPRPLLLVGSIGVARALRRALPIDPGSGTDATPVPARGAGVLVVLGSVHPTARAQREHAGRVGVFGAVMEVSVVGGERVGQEAARALQAGRAVALAAPDQVTAGHEAAVAASLRAAVASALATARPAGIVLVGGETAFHVLDGLGHPPLAIETRPAPLVVRGRVAAGPHRGMPVITKGGSSGEPELLASLVKDLAAGAG